MKQPLRIGITCYPTFGGSGVVATEIGMAMAARGHRVHFIAYDIPRRLSRFAENIYYHEVETHEYPLFVHPPYSISLASKMVEVTTYENLDILHVHYAVPHATSAYLARQVLGDKAPKIITTLHGTDITLVGNNRSFLPITRFSIMESDGITVPSRYLKNATYDKLNVPSTTEIEVIPNFVDTESYRPRQPNEPDLRPFILRDCAKLDQMKLIAHVSNFRPVKRLDDVVAIFQKIQQEIPSHLVLIGDGPERSRIEKLVHDLGLTDNVCFLGKQESFIDILQHCDAFLLPSESESFGLAALEAMSCGVPVIASNVGGIPEVVEHGLSGFLADVGDIEAMANYSIKLLGDQALHQKLSAYARNTALEKYEKHVLTEKYENYYYRVLGEKKI